MCQCNEVEVQHCWITNSLFEVRKAVYSNGLSQL